MTQQSSNLTNWTIIFCVENDRQLMTWETEAENRKDAYLKFWAAHDNPHIIIASCQPESTPRIKGAKFWYDEYSNQLPTELSKAFADAFKSRGTSIEEFMLPAQIHTEDEMLIRAVYGVAALWVQDGEELYNDISNALHLISQHSMRMVLVTGEHPTPLADSNLYTYCRDAAMFFDFVANGDNAVFTEKGVYNTAVPYFLDLLSK